MAFGLISLKSLYGVARYFLDKENRSEYALVRVYVYMCVSTSSFFMILWQRTLMALHNNYYSYENRFFTFPDPVLLKLSVLLYGNPTTPLFFLDFLHTISLNAIAK